MKKLNVKDLIEKIKTSTGDVESTFSFESVCTRLIDLSQVEKELKSAIKVLKDSVEGHIVDLPFENEDGSIIIETRSIYEQDIATLQKELPKEVFLRAATITKTKLSNDKDEKKKFSALVDLHSHKVGESSYVKVNLKELRKAKGMIQVEVEPEEL